MSGTRDLNGAVENVRRSAFHSVSLLKAATHLSNGAPAAANEPGVKAAPMRPALSVISSNTEMTGSITTTDELHVHGRIEGDVRAAAITVCAGGVVKGDLNAETIVIDGDVDGRIEGQHVLLRDGAVVSGEIMHGSLGIDTAAVFEGTIKRVAARAPVATE